MHYSTLSLRHGYSHLDGNGRGKVPQPNNNETIDYWMRTPLNLTHLYYDKLPVSPAYAEEDHSGYEYLLRPRKPLCIMIYAILHLDLLILLVCAWHHHQHYQAGL